MKADESCSLSVVPPWCRLQNPEVALPAERYLLAEAEAKAPTLDISYVYWRGLELVLCESSNIGYIICILARSGISIVSPMHMHSSGVLSLVLFGRSWRTISPPLCGFPHSENVLLMCEPLLLWPSFLLVEVQIILEQIPLSSFNKV